jgi:hypothetical protein
MKRLVLGLAVSVSLAAGAQAQDASVLSQWVQLTPGGGNEVRVVTTAEKCPSLSVDGASIAMTERAPPNPSFKVHLCSVTISNKAKSASVDGKTLRLFHTNPQRVMVFGDTGCRIKGSTIQDCNDPKQWPFPDIAAEAAKLKPELVIHVGDYLYRESPCPDGDKRCAGTPYGDNWPAWAADFFTPAAPLLASSPWVFVRGNHEDCERSGLGWLRLLGPQPFNPVAGCAEHLALYTVPLGEVELAVMDNADAPDITIDSDLRAEYEADFADLAKSKALHLWLAMHRPIWGAITGPFSIPMGGNRTLIASLTNAHALDRVQLMLAGHIHTFEAMNYRGSAPPQIIAGFGGDNLDSAPSDLSGANLGGGHVKDGISIGGFGFLMMEREKTGWRIDVYKVDGTIEKVCRFASRTLTCAKD